MQLCFQMVGKMFTSPNTTYSNDINVMKNRKQTDLAELTILERTVVRDKAPMANRYPFESLSQTFQDIMENQLLFGGKTIIEILSTNTGC